MNEKLVLYARTFILYLVEMGIFYGIAFACVYVIDGRKAAFLSGLSAFFVLCASLVERPAAPHLLLTLFVRPTVLLMFVVVVGFGVLGAGRPDFTVIAPGFALVLLGAAFAERLAKSGQR